MTSPPPPMGEIPPRSLLFVPAHRARAVDKARNLIADLVILDLEDAVPPEAKNLARAGAQGASGFGPRLAIRINPANSADHHADRDALATAPPALIVLPKVESVAEVTTLTSATGRPVVAMIESAAGLLAAPEIARASAGLMLGSNDLALDLGLPADADDGAAPGLAHARGVILIAARAARVPAYDGVFNRLDDPDGLAAACRRARALGFDGKTLIHPDQIAPCHQAFAPAPSELDDAQALVAAAAEGAMRFRGRMVEALHVEAARRLLARAAD